MVDWATASTREKLFSSTPRRVFEALCVAYPDTLVYFLWCAARRATLRYDALYELLDAILHPPTVYESRSFVRKEKKPSLRTLLGILSDLPWQDTLTASLWPLIKEARRSWYQQFSNYQEQDTAAAFMVGVKKTRQARDPLQPRYKGPLDVTGGAPAVLKSGPGPWKVDSSILRIEFEGVLHEFAMPDNVKARIDSLSSFLSTDTIDLVNDSVPELLAAPGPYSFIYFEGSVSINCSASSVTASSPIFGNSGSGDTITLGGSPYVILTVVDSYSVTVAGSPGAAFTSARLTKPKVINVVYNGVSFTVENVAESGIAADYASTINTLVGETIAYVESDSLVLRGSAVTDTLEIGEGSPFYFSFGFTEASSEGKAFNREFSVEAGAVAYTISIPPGSYTPGALATELDIALSSVAPLGATVFNDDSTGVTRKRIRLSATTDSPLASIRWVQGGNFPLTFPNVTGAWSWVTYEDLPVELREPTLFSSRYVKRLIGTFQVSNASYTGPDGTVYIPSVGIRHATSGSLDFALPDTDTRTAQVYEEYLELTSIENGPTSSIEVIDEALGFSGLELGSTTTIPGMQEGDVVTGAAEATVIDGVLVPPIPNITQGTIRLVSAALAALDKFEYIEPPGETFYDACAAVHGGKKGLERDRIARYLSRIPYRQTLPNVSDTLGMRFLEELEERGYDAVLEKIYLGDLSGAYQDLVDGKVRTSDAIRAEAVELMSTLASTRRPGFGYNVAITRDLDLETELQEEPPDPLDPPVGVYSKDD